jgi:uncharacterized repeat protein (TIGR02543 family)
MTKKIIFLIILMTAFIFIGCPTEPEPEGPFSLDLSVNDTSMGNVYVNPEQPSNGYEKGTEVTLIVIPKTGYDLIEWGGENGEDVTTQDDEHTIIMDSDKTVVANFAIKKVNLTVNIEDIDGTGDPTGDGADVTVDPQPDTDGYDYGTTVTLTPQNSNMGSTGWLFQEWGDGTSTIPRQITLTEDEIVTAKFQLLNIYTLNASATNGSVRIEGFGGIDADGSIHPESAVVNVYATPVAGYEFTGWTGDATGTDNPYSLTMDSAKTVSATFAPVTYTFIEDFEDDFTPDTWTTYWQAIGADSNADPTINEVYTLNGGKSMELFAVEQDDYRMWNILNVRASQQSTVTFWVKVDSSDGFNGTTSNRDKFMCYLDDQEEVVAYGDYDWQQHTITIPEGDHEIMFGYFAFNLNDSEGEDAAWVDDIVLGEFVNARGLGPELRVMYDDIEMPNDGGTTPEDLGDVAQDSPFIINVMNTGVPSDNDDTITVSDITMATTTDLTITTPTLPATIDVGETLPITFEASGTTQITSGLVTITTDYPTAGSTYSFKFIVTPVTPVFLDDFEGDMEPDVWSDIYLYDSYTFGDLAVIDQTNGYQGGDALYFGLDSTTVAVIEIEVGAGGAKLSTIYKYDDNDDSGGGYAGIWDNSDSPYQSGMTKGFVPSLDWSVFNYDLTPGSHEIMIKLYNSSGRKMWIDDFKVFGDAVVQNLIPEMEVYAENQASGDGYIADGSVDYNLSDILDGQNITFRIENDGKDELNLTGTPLVTVTGDGSLDTSSLPTTPIVYDDSTTFTVIPTAGAGSKNISISINNDDPDEAPYNFNVLVNVNSGPFPILQVNYTDYVSGSPTNLTDKTYEFTLVNIGTGDETLNSPYIQVDDANFFVSDQPNSGTIPSGGGSENFDIDFNSNGLASQIYTTTVTVNSVTTPFSFTLQVEISDPVVVFMDDFEDGVDPAWAGFDYDSGINPGDYTNPSVIDMETDPTIVNWGSQCLRIGIPETTSGDDNQPVFHSTWAEIYYEFATPTDKEYAFRFKARQDAQYPSWTDYLMLYPGTSWTNKIWDIDPEPEGSGGPIINDIWLYEGDSYGGAYAPIGVLPVGTSRFAVRFKKGSGTSMGKDVGWIDDFELLTVPD